MDPSIEIAALRSEMQAKIDGLENRLAQIPRDNSASQIASLLNRLDVLSREFDTVRNRLNSFRGANGITVQGNIISLDSPKNQRATTSTILTGCGNGIKAFCQVDATVPFSPL